MSSRRRPPSGKRFIAGDAVTSAAGQPGTVQGIRARPDGRHLYRVRWQSGFESWVRPITLERRA